jgi:hypothetical protein
MFHFIMKKMPVKMHQTRIFYTVTSGESIKFVPEVSHLYIADNVKSELSNQSYNLYF